jgi:phage antirepressor YoqD-like protein
MNKTAKKELPPKSAAIVTIFDGAKMTKAGRKRIAKWLRSRADLLEKHGDLLAPRFVSRWLYEDTPK